MNNKKSKLEIGKIYKHYDNFGGHNALIYKIDKNKNNAFFVQFTSKSKNNTSKIRRNINPKATSGHSYLINNPFYDNIRKFRKGEVKYRVHEDDSRKIKSIISKEAIQFPHKNKKTKR